MATESHKYSNRLEQETRHSALKEFSRDERRPAVLLLSALLIAVLFFGIGLLFGRWTAEPETNAHNPQPGKTLAASAQAEATPQPTVQQSTNARADMSDAARHFTLLIGTFDSSEKARPLIKTLEEAGYTDVRTSTPRAGEQHATYSVMVGHYTQDEARAAAQRMHSANDPQLKNAKIIEEQ